MLPLPLPELVEYLLTDQDLKRLAALKASLAAHKRVAKAISRGKAVKKNKPPQRRGLWIYWASGNVSYPDLVAQGFGFDVFNALKKKSGKE